MDADNIEDVNREHDEQWQLQNLDDEQQLQEDDGEGINDVQEEEREEEAERDDESTIIDYETLSREEILDLACGKIEQNVLTFHLPDLDINIDDDQALRLGKALLGNTELYTLSVRFTVMRAEFASRGTRAFVGGFLGSQISELTITAEEELPSLEMSQIFGSRSIQDISLHYPIGDDFAIQLDECFTTASKLLKRLSIRVDQLTSRGARALSNYLQRSPAIKVLEFVVSRDAITTALSSTMQVLYLEGVQHCRNIVSLVLSRVMGDMQALTKTIPKLYQLYIEHVGLSIAEVELLAQGLSDDTSRLYTLSLENCDLNDEHMSILSPVLGTHPSIKTLELHYNQIGDSGIASFVEHWSSASSIIKEFKLAKNNIGPTGAQRLISFVANHHLTLRSLYLWGNTSIGFDGLKLIGEALPNAKIAMLGLHDIVEWIEYEDAACNNEAVIQESKRVAAGKALLEGVRNNTHLSMQTRVHSLHLPINVKKEIDLYVDANRLGRRAVFENQHLLPRGVWCHFLAKKGMTRSLMFLFLRELPGVIMDGSRNNTSIGRKRCRLM